MHMRTTTTTPPPALPPQLTSPAPVPANLLPLAADLHPGCLPVHLPGAHRGGGGLLPQAAPHPAAAPHADGGVEGLDAGGVAAGCWQLGRGLVGGGRRQGVGGCQQLEWRVGSGCGGHARRRLPHLAPALCMRHAPITCTTTLIPILKRAGPVPAVPLLQCQGDLQCHPRVHCGLRLDDRLW